MSQQLLINFTSQSEFIVFSPDQYSSIQDRVTNSFQSSFSYFLRFIVAESESADENEESEEESEEGKKKFRIRPSDAAIALDDYENFPYGKDYEPITLETLQQVASELGIIKLCWPVITEPNFEGNRKMNEID